MSLNCRPGQLAWIDVPRTPVNESLGLRQLQGHVVMTVRLLQQAELPVPNAWLVEPTQSCRVVGPIPPHMADVLRVGMTVVATAIPDSYLRPFEDLPPEKFEDLAEEVKHAIGCRE